MKKIHLLIFFTVLLNFLHAQTCTPTITASPASMCAGATTTLTSMGATNYTWIPGGMNTSSVVANPSATSTYTLIAATGTCTATETITIYVNPNPTISATSCNLCPGTSCTLTCNGAITYSWVPGIGLSSTAGANTTANPPSTTVYTVIGTDANGCTGITTTTVFVSPNPTITVNNLTLCQGTGNYLTANGASSSYNWIPSSGLSSTTGNQVLANPNVTTIYTVTGTSGTCVSSATAMVTVFQNPSVSFTLTPDPTPHIWNVNVTYSGGTPPYYVGWYWGDLTSDTGLYPSHTYTAAGFYDVCDSVLDANLCPATFCVNDSLYRSASSSAMIQLNVVNNAMNIKNGSEANSNQKIYPNPAKNTVTVSINRVSENSQVKIIDMLGNQIKNTELKIQNGSIQIDVSSFEKGIYFIQTQSNGKTYTGKFVKE